MSRRALTFQSRLVGSVPPQPTLVRQTSLVGPMHRLTLRQRPAPHHPALRRSPPHCPIFHGPMLHSPARHSPMLHSPVRRSPMPFPQAPAQSLLFRNPLHHALVFQPLLPRFPLRSRQRVRASLLVGRMGWPRPAALSRGSHAKCRYGRHKRQQGNSQILQHRASSPRESSSNSEHTQQSPPGEVSRTAQIPAFVTSFPI